MSRVWIIMVAAAMLLAPYQTLCAQEQERQVAFDPKGTLFVLSGDQNQRWGILSGFPTLVEARIFLSGDSTYALELTLADDGSRVRSRQSITTAEYADIVARVGTAMETYRMDVSGAELDQSGRSRLLWGSTLWSLFYYGAATSTAFTGEPDLAWTYLVAGGLGYLVPALLTNDSPVTEGQATLALGGMFQGALHGWAITALIQGEDTFDDPQLAFGLSVATGITETVVGYIVAGNNNLEEGKASVLATTAFYGLTTGLFTSAAIFDQVDTDSDPAVRLGAGLALAGTVGGLFVGNAIADAQHFAPGDGTIYATTGLLGLTLPISIIGAIQPESISGTLVGALSIVGTVGGLWAGTQIIRGKDYRSADGTVTILSTLGGGLIGLGVGVAIGEGQETVILPWVGAAGGFALSLALAKPEREQGFMGQLEFDFNPAAPWMTTTDRFGFLKVAPMATISYRL